MCTHGRKRLRAPTTRMEKNMRKVYEIIQVATTLTTWICGLVTAYYAVITAPWWSGAAVTSFMIYKIAERLETRELDKKFEIIKTNRDSIKANLWVVASITPRAQSFILDKKGTVTQLQEDAWEVRMPTDLRSNRDEVDCLFYYEEDKPLLLLKAKRRRSPRQLCLYAER